MTDYDKIEFVKGIISNTLEKLGVNAQVEFEDSLIRGLVFNISTRDSKLLIGREGQTLHSLEVLIHAMVAKNFSGSDKPFYFSIDVDDYKRKREWYLKQLATAAVDKLKTTQQPLTLEPMPKYERKLIHMHVQENFPEVVTESIGNEPKRKIKLSLK